jgi:hypothetical protein
MGSLINLGTSTSGSSITTGMFMVPLQIHVRKRPFTARADSLNLSQVSLVHMPSVAILPDNSRAAVPCAPHFLLDALRNREMRLTGG